MEMSKRFSPNSVFKKVGLGVIFALLLCLYLLPQLITTQWFATSIKDVVNTNIPGQISFSTITATWLDGVQVHNLVYKDSASKYLLKAEEINTEKGLFTLVSDYKHIGKIYIKRPIVSIVLPAQKADMKPPGKTDQVKSNKDPSTLPRKQTGPAEAKSEQSAAIFKLPEIHAQIQVTEGQLVTISSQNIVKNVVENLNFYLGIDGATNIVDYQLSFNGEKNIGEIRGKGSISLGTKESSSTNITQSKGVLEIHDWQVAGILEIASSMIKAPSGDGIINGRLLVSEDQETGIEISGNLYGHKINLQGGPLQSDTPSIDEIEIDLSVNKIKEIITIQNLKIKSPLLTGTVTGAVSTDLSQTISARAKADVAEIFSQFPASLNLKKDVRITEGTIDFTADISSSDSTETFAVNASLHRLAGTAAEKNIVWEEPVSFAIQGNRKPDALNVDQLSIKSSFLQASGNSDSEAMQLQLTADVGTALNEFAQFINLAGWNSKGKLDLNLKMSGSEKELKTISSDIKITDFELSHNGKQLSPSNTFTAAIKSNVHLNSEMKPEKFSDIRVDFTSWLGRGTLIAPSYTLRSADFPGVLDNGTVDAQLELEHITTLLHTLETIPQDQNFSGALDLSLQISGENIEKPSISLSAEISPFTYQTFERILTEEKIHLELEAGMDFPQKFYEIKNLNISSLPAGINLNATILPGDQEQTLSAEGTTHFDLEALSTQLRSFAGLEIEMKGTSQKTFTLQASTTGGKWKDIPKHADFSSTLIAEQIKGYGLIIDSLELPIQLQDSTLKIDITAQVNRGTMTGQPEIDFTGVSPVATLPDDSTIFNGVELTGGMSNDLLAKIHPLFKGVSVTLGTVNLDMQYLSWPLDKELQKDVIFAGAFTFNNVKLQAGALLSPLLAIMKQEEHEIILKDQPMIFTGQNERITCSPLEATVNGYSLILEGSIGFDQSLEYTAKIPVTRKMISGDIYKYLEGTFIVVPITGTVSKPSISNRFIQNALSDLAVQAGKKQITNQAGKLLQKLFQ